MTPETSTAPTPTIGDDDQDPFIADLREIWAGNTLVLVGCGEDKRDPDDPVDVHEAAVAPDEGMPGPGTTDETGPAWEAQDLYTSSYFSFKRQFAETLVGAATDARRRWHILSAEHEVVSPTRVLKRYDTSIDDLGDDPTNPDHRVRNPYGIRRPDGEEIVTELDQWAHLVAAGLCKWVAEFRPEGADPDANEMGTLLVLAGQSYINPLRDRGVFEYGIARQTGDPNQGWPFPLETRFLFEEIDAGGYGEQMAWLSDAVDRLGDVADASEQAEVGQWTGETRCCESCGAGAEAATLLSYGDAVYCEACKPEPCSRCGSWTHETGLGAYPLCTDCQTDRGGRLPDAADSTPGDQSGFSGWSE